jgi:hypothetical protein
MVHRLAEAPGSTTMHMARVTVEIHGRVPIAELDVTVGVVRDGRRIQLLTAQMGAAGVVVATATAWRIARLHTVPPTPDMPPLRWSPATARRSGAPAVLGPGFHRDSVEMRFSAGEFLEEGRSFGWIRLTRPVVDDLPPTPVERAVAAADFGNGFSSYLDPAQYVFINTDLTVHLVREPRGEWIGLDTHTMAGDDGPGVALGPLFDETGAIGHTAQTLLIQPR